MRILIIISVVLIGGVQSLLADAPVVGRRIEPFTLQDSLGASRSLAEFMKSKAIVVVFLGTECPLAKLYGPRLAALAKKFAKRGVAIVGINSNRQDSLLEIEHYAHTSGIKFPILKDSRHKVADQFGAKRTPEVFLLDAKRKVCYHGRIDDQFGVGTARSEAKRHDLVMALEELLAGSPISVTETPAVGCFIGRAKNREPTGDVTWSNQIVRIINQRCLKCHRKGEVAPFSMTDYDEVIGWVDTIQEVIEIGRMPPWHANPKYGKFHNDARMPDSEKELIYTWIRNGMPKGDAKQLPKPPQFTDGWQIPKPQVVYRMPQPYKVAARGVVPYQYFIVDPQFKEDKWVIAAEARPGNRSVVHHIILFYIPPDRQRHREEDALFNSVATFAPGMPPILSGDHHNGMARRIPAGSKLAFQVHYTPVGTEQFDLSEAGLVFADPKSVRKEINIQAALNYRFRIPPGAGNHRVEASVEMRQDTLLLALAPHMHLRGKSFRFEAIFPDKRREVLLDVPRYDFNWQHIYFLKKPMELPAGSKLHCIAHFDNSADNLVNPNPKIAVGWGDQTWQEMMVGYLVTGLAEQDLTIGPPRVKNITTNRFEVEFRYRPTGKAKTVALAGSFNQWNSSNLPLDGPDKDGWYRKTLGMLPGRYEYKFVVNGDQWHHDPGNRELAGFYGNSVLLLGKPDRKRGTPKGKPKRPIRFAWFVEFSPDGRWLVAPYGGWDADEQGEIRVWDVKTGKARFVIPSRRGVRAATWSPKGSFFASGNYAGDVSLYDSKSGKPTLEISTEDGSAELVQITPDERKIIVGSGTGKISIWNTATGELLHTLPGHSASVWGMRLAPDGKTLASAGKDRTVRVWNIESGKQLHKLIHPDPTNGVAFTSDSGQLVTGCWDGQIRFWDLASGKSIRSLIGHQSSVNDFDFSPSGDLLASSGGDQTIRLWDAATGTPLATLAGHDQGVYGVRFSPDGAILASGSWDTTIKLWDVKQKKAIKTLKR